MAISDLIPWKRNKNVPIRRNNYRSSLQKEINRLFDEFDKVWDSDFFSPMVKSPLSDFRPSINLSENDNEYIVTAELPGMDENDVSVELRNGGLIIKGEKKHESEEKKDGYIYSERSYGSFNRQIPLPDEIDVEKVDAKFKKGVLKITLPKTEKAKASHKQINIKTE